MDHYLRQIVSELVCVLNRAPRKGEDPNNYVWPEVSGGLTRLSYCTYLDADGITSRCAIIIETDCPRTERGKGNGV